ncbi:dCMP deaminase [Nematocida ausubeli]|uniref:dCMP deaminase n=1 Tax=Nematocida ausubeli (strain ATCC PRA-371 / ERTm2) TaxID=1913371 RepID=A0A086J1V9_NEMA1|nr:uncharacterized protein NESG_01242 [Nematocida ausubeli]KAI5136310.1 dCMP deaminase [Nematocida ausubeli]KAI5137094.1 dCMP deaminase [Nematocida ausubeli]KAI5161660.1 dCMP deaminase [Nematocida ausubeli]KFG26127.1 hypothetical protein NESG_01242 [Nematocida ausubeli]
MLRCVTSAANICARLAVKNLVQNGATEIEYYPGVITEIMSTGKWSEDIVIHLRKPQDWKEFNTKPLAALIVVYPTDQKSATESEIEESTNYHASLLQVRRDFLNTTNLIEISDTEIDTIKSYSIRPNWEKYFMLLAQTASTRSNCMKRKVGAVVVKHNRVLCTGYNGTSTSTTNCLDGGCNRCNGNAKKGTELSDCFCIHAEESVFLERSRAELFDSDLYTTLYPCRLCARKIVQVKIKRVYYMDEYVGDAEVQSLFERNGIEVHKIQK